VTLPPHAGTGKRTPICARTFPRSGPTPSHRELARRGCGATVEWWNLATTGAVTGRRGDDPTRCSRASSRSAAFA
jgi:hypothetical protein